MIFGARSPEMATVVFHRAQHPLRHVQVTYLQCKSSDSLLVPHRAHTSRLLSKTTYLISAAHFLSKTTTYSYSHTTYNNILIQHTTTYSYSHTTYNNILLLTYNNILILTYNIQQLYVDLYPTVAWNPRYCLPQTRATAFLLNITVTIFWLLCVLLGLPFVLSLFRV
jgi:hypothetical protein